MLIRMKKTVHLKDGGRWTIGARMRTTAEELSRREVPSDSYQVITPDKTPKPTDSKGTTPAPSK